MGRRRLNEANDTDNYNRSKMPICPHLVDTNAIMCLMLLYVLSFMSKVFCKIRLVRHMANQTDDYHNGKCNHNAADFTKALVANVSMWTHRIPLYKLCISPSNIPPSLPLLLHGQTRTIGAYKTTATAASFIMFLNAP